MHYVSDLFGKVLCMFRTGPMSIIRSISTLYIRNRYLSCQFCWCLLAWSGCPYHACRHQQNQHDKYLLRVYSFEILLMMDIGRLQNMQSTLPHKSDPGVAQRVGRGIALLFHNHGTRRGLVVSSTPWPHFTPRKDLVPILQDAGCAPGPFWTLYQINMRNSASNWLLL